MYAQVEQYYVNKCMDGKLHLKDTQVNPQKLHTQEERVAIFRQGLGHISRKERLTDTNVREEP